MRILAADFLLPISSEPIEDGAIAFEKGIICEIGRSSALRKRYPAAEFEDFGEAVILPGFVNCHSHLELTAMRGFLDDVEADFFKWLIKLATTREKHLAHNDIRISAICGAIEGVRSGITCFGDIGRYGRAGLDALKKIGLRGIIYQETEFSPLDENATEDFYQLKEKYRALLSDRTDLVGCGISPHAPYTVSRRLFELITDFALADKIPISIHAAESIAEESLMLSNSGVIADFYRERGIFWSAPAKSSIQYLSEIGILQAQPLLAHCIQTNEADLELIKSSGSGVAHCPKSNAKFGHRAAPFELFLDSGLRLGIGSDSMASNNHCDLIEEGRFAALSARRSENKKRLVTGREIIESITLGGAKAMGLGQLIGSLELGKQADLTILSLKNLAQQPIHDIYSAIIFASSGRDVIMTMVAGNEVYRDGDVKSIDENELKGKLKAIATKMRETALSS